MNQQLFIIIVSLFGAIYIWIGKISSKNQKTTQDYFLMGKNLKAFKLTLTLLATQLGGGTIVGAAFEAYEKGPIVLLYPLGASLGLIFLSLGFGSKLKKLNISTIAEIFEKVYGSIFQRKIASILSIIAMFFILIAEALAIKNFFITLGFSNPLVFIIFWMILATYTTMGGLKAVVNTDVLQILFILMVLVLTFFFIKIPTSAQFTQTSLIGSFTKSQTINIPWITWLFMPFLFMLIEQDMGQRCFAAKNPKVVSISAFISGVLLFLSSCIAIYFGILAKKIGLENSPNILIEVIKKITNPVFSSFFMSAIFMAIISTADSILCSISSNLSYDFLSLKKISNTKQVQISKFLTLIISMIALVLAYIFKNVVALLMLSYELSVYGVFIPIVAGTLLKNPSKLGSILSITSGFLGFVFFKLYPINTFIPKEVLIILFSLFCYFLGTQIDTKKAFIKTFKKENIQ